MIQIANCTKIEYTTESGETHKMEFLHDLDPKKFDATAKHFAEITPVHKDSLFALYIMREHPQNTVVPLRIAREMGVVPVKEGENIFENLN